ncbi:MAG: TIR domain-containing protein [Chitinophagaceae bacterium]|jgi:hypothetical protein
MGIRGFEYDIAFSFAEEDRSFVSRVVDILQNLSVNVYYDENKRIENWGEDLRAHIHNVYLNEARFCMIFISEHYKKKYWTQFEQERIKAKSFFSENKQAYILPFRLDNTEIAGITDTIIYLTAEKLNEEQLAEAIFNKISKEKAKNKFLSGNFFFAMITLSVVALGLITISRSEFSERPRFVSDSGQISTGRTASKIIPASNSNKLFKAIKEWHFKAVCKDGWLSESQGSGTCSGHRGIDHYVDTVVYGDTKEQCREQSMCTFKLRGQ